MLVYIVGLHPNDLTVEYIRTEELTLTKEVLLYEANEHIVPMELNPMCVKGIRISERDNENENETKIKIVFDESMGYAWKELRRKRHQLLTESDWTQFADVKLSPEKKDAWALYRQNLRDLPSITKNPLTVVWPNVPQ